MKCILAFNGCSINTTVARSAKINYVARHYKRLKSINRYTATYRSNYNNDNDNKNNNTNINIMIIKYVNAVDATKQGRLKGGIHCETCLPNSLFSSLATPSFELNIYIIKSRLYSMLARFCSNDYINIATTTSTANNYQNRTNNSGNTVNFLDTRYDPDP